MISAKRWFRVGSRIVTPLGAIFLLPHVVGVSVYAEYLLQFYFFLGVVSLLSSPLEHILIHLSSRGHYQAHFCQLVLASLCVSAALCVFSGIAYFYIEGVVKHNTVNKVQLFLIAITVVSFQTGYFLKFFKRDCYYEYFEIIAYCLILIGALLLASTEVLDIKLFICVNAIAYIALCIVRYAQIRKTVVAFRFRWYRLAPVLITAYRYTTLPSMIGAFIKRADSFYMPLYDATASSILLYRLVRNSISIMSLYGNIRAQDSWMGEKNAREKKFSLLVFISISIFSMAAILAASALYFLWIKADFVVDITSGIYVLIAVVSVSYLMLFAVDINRAFEYGRFDLILKGALISLVVFLALIIFGLLLHINELSFLLILVFIPQLSNGIYLKMSLHNSGGASYKSKLGQKGKQ